MRLTTEQAIAKAFDEFILATGGNVDPRGAYNRTRRELMKFWDKVVRIDTDAYSQIQIAQAMKKIIKERIVYTKPQGKTKFSVYDCMGNKLKDV
jgi:hypothetical protein